MKKLILLTLMACGGAGGGGERAEFDELGCFEPMTQYRYTRTVLDGDSTCVAPPGGEFVTDDTGTPEGQSSRDPRYIDVLEQTLGFDASCKFMESAPSVCLGAASIQCTMLPLGQPIWLSIISLGNEMTISSGDGTSVGYNQTHTCRFGLEAVGL